MEGKEEYFNSEKYEIKSFDWRRTNRMTDIITLLNKARRENAALQSTWNLTFCTIENPNLIAYIKMTDDLSSAKSSIMATSGEKPSWTFFTNHTHVLVFLSTHPDSPLPIWGRVADKHGRKLSLAAQPLTRAENSTRLSSANRKRS